MDRPPFQDAELADPSKRGSGMENPSFEMSEQDAVVPLSDNHHNYGPGIGDGDSNVINRGKNKTGSKVSLDFDIDPNKPTLPNGNGEVGVSSKNKRGNIVSRIIEGSRSSVANFIHTNKIIFKNLAILSIFLAYNAYLVTAIAYTVRHETPVAWCDGLGFLIVLTGITYWSLFYYFILKGMFGKAISQNILKPISNAWKAFPGRRWVVRGIALLCFGGIAAFIIIDCWDEPRRLVSASGVFILLFVTLLLSKHPGDVQWRQVIAGLSLQFCFGLLVLRWEGGRSFLECVSSKVTKFLAYADAGSTFIYNFAASGQLEIINSTIPELTGHVLTIPTTFAFTSLSVIFFFSFVVQLLYHIGVMLWVVRKVGWLLRLIVGTSAAESMNAAANIFLGQTEAPLLIKPFMDDLTKSELHAVMTGGFATIAGTVMAAYISFGVKAESLLSASVMAAPCALGLSKLIYPETEVSRTTAKMIKNAETKTEGNALDAAAKGAVEGVYLVGCILANILAFVSFITFANSVLSWFGALVGVPQLTFNWLLGKLFIPIALCIGVDPNDAENVALLLGLKIVVNEFIAYSELQAMVAKGLLTERSRRLAEYALCGFANFSSIGIQLGGLGALAPKRRPELADIVWRALFAGATASLINACVAGTLLSFADEELVNNSTSTMSSLAF